MTAAGPRPTETYLDEYIGYQTIETCIVMTVLATFFLSFRFYSKLLLMGMPWGAEDALLVAAYVSHEGLCILGILMVRYAGVGYHTEWVEANKPWLLARWAKYILAFELTHFGAVCLPKLAIVRFYLRIFQWTGGRMRAAAAAVQVLLVAAWLVSCVVAGLQCRPLAFWWDPTVPGGGWCIDIEAFFHAQAIASPVLDCLVVALPIPTICSLSLAPLKKMELIFIFAVGSFGMIASIIRAEVFFNTAPFDDKTWASVALNKWSVIEVGSYIITACLLDLKPLLQRCSGRRAPRGGNSIKLDNRPNESPSHVTSARTPVFDEEELLAPPTAVATLPERSRPEDATGAEQSPTAPISPGHAWRWHEPHNSLRSWSVSGGGTAMVPIPEASAGREKN